MFPIGKGQKDFPKAGNALLFTQSRRGQTVKTPLWLSQIYTDLNLQVDVAQLKGGLTYRPIRLQERFLTFSVLFNQRDRAPNKAGVAHHTLERASHEQLVERIKDHWVYSLSITGSVPMKLHYFGMNKTFQGYIENAGKHYMVTDVVLSFDFRMRLINTVASPSTVSGKAPYAPHAGDIEFWGKEWYTMAEFYSEVIGTGNESNNNRNKDHTKKRKDKGPGPSD